MRDLAEEAVAAAKRLRNQGIEIKTDVEEGSVESGQNSTQTRKTAEMEKDGSETGKENKPEGDKNNSELTARDASREAVEGSRNHPKNRYDPKDDDIVARQLREAAEDRDQQLATENDDHDPERQDLPAEDDGDFRGRLAQRHDVEGDEGANDEQFVGDRIGEFPEVGDLAISSCEVTVPDVGYAGGDEEDECDEKLAEPSAQNEHEDHWRRDDACDGKCVR